MSVGGIVGENTGTLQNVINKGNINAKSEKDELQASLVIGGVAAYSKGEIKGEIRNEGAIKLEASILHGIAVAGVIGYLEGALNDAVNEGSVTITADYVKAKSQIYETKNGTPAAAGIVAYGNGDQFQMKNCKNSAPVFYTLSAVEKYTTANMNRNQFAGIVANPYGPVEDCINDAAVNITIKASNGKAFTGSNHEHIVCVGGIGGGDYFAGSDQNLTSYKNCVNNGDITVETDAAQANSAVGGICGWPGKEGSRKNSTSYCENNGTVTLKGLGKARIGGIHGGSGIVDNCTNNGSVRLEGGAEASVAGGIAGFSSNGFKISNSISKGNITSLINAQGVGGIIGNIGNSDNSGQEFPGCSVACVVRNADMTNEYTGMVIGKYNGATALVSIGSAEHPVLVKGRINLGGNICCLGARPDGDAWRIGIRDPEDPDSLLGLVAVSDRAVVTSGCYERFFTGEDGAVYGHIFDPATGRPAESGLASVTVISSSGLRCDALTTALYVLGAERSADVLARLDGVEAVLAGEDGELWITPGLRDIFTARGRWESAPIHWL